METVNIYMSIPAHMPEETKKNIAKRVRESCPYSVNVNYWSVGTFYDSLSVHKCDIFIVVNEHNNWISNVNLLPAGVRRELKLAASLDKPIFTAYETTNKEINFYSTTLTVDSLAGIAGTSTNLAKKVSSLSNKESYVWEPDDIKELKQPAKTKSCLIEAPDQRLLL